MLLSGCYDIPAVEVIVTGARTNKVPTAPYRGAGRPEATYLIETTIDAAARELGVDALELRRRNLVRAFPYRTALGWTYDSGDFERCLDTALALLGPRARTRRFARAARGPAWTAAPEAVDRRAPASWASPPPALERREVLVGVGVALCVERSGGLFEHATVRRSVTASSSASARRRPARATTRCSRRSRRRASASTRRACGCAPGTPTRSPTASARSRRARR